MNQHRGFSLSSQVANVALLPTQGVALNTFIIPNISESKTRMLRLCVFLSLFVFGLNHVEAWSLQTVKQDRIDSTSSRRGFFSAVSTTLIASGSSYFGLTFPASAASPQVFTTPSGIKYATIKPATGKGSPQDKDIVAIEYTGYLTDGTIFGTSSPFSRWKSLSCARCLLSNVSFETDSTHAEGKQV
jgi:hypothetical protein